MTILIDSMIWIYFFDKNSKENTNINKWLKSTITNESILISSIIPLEVAHNLYRTPNLDKNVTENLIFKWISQKNITIVEVTELVMITALEKIKSLRMQGIGGRDCIILASMLLNNVDTIITHDKNILSLKSFHRIDPVFNPPLDIKIGEKNESY